MRLYALSLSLVALMSAPSFADEGTDSTLNRAVGVTSGGIQEGLKSIYNATELLSEILGQ